MIRYRYNGPGLRLNTGVLVFLTGTVGLHFNLGYDSHYFTLREQEINGQLRSLDGFEATLFVRGVDGIIGLVFRF